MFICEDCNELFEECKIIEEHHLYGMGMATEEWHVCPHCESRNFKKAKKCKICGEYFAELEADDICDVCHGDMYGE